MPNLSCIMITYRRFTCVERSIAMFLAQDYTGDSELILLNTDMEHPLALGESMAGKKIFLFNDDTDSVTGLPYTSTGAIRRDATILATGDYYICWDDDDIFLPWNNRQGMEGLQRNGTKAFKPWRSFFATGNRVELARNSMEASITVELAEVKDSFNMESGKEHLGWYMRLRDCGQLKEDSKDSVPSYCFNWSDTSEVGGHKQSSTIDALDNFERHKRETRDFAKRPLELVDLTKVYQPYYDYFRNHKDEFNPEYFDRYVAQYL